MTPLPHPKYFIVKQGLDAFKALPNFIWNTSERKSHIPRGYRQIEKGDRWIGFAYTTSDKRERRLSLITGFFECAEEAYSTAFLSHRHEHQVRERRFKGDDKPVAVLCWIDDDRDKALKPYVHRVYELQALIREGRKIRW